MNDFETQQRAINLIHRYTLSTLLALGTRGLAQQEQIITTLMNSIAADAVGAIDGLHTQGAIPEALRDQLTACLKEEATLLRDWATGSAQTGQAQPNA